MIGTAEIFVILFVILLLFGGKKLPEFARNLGKGLHEFKKACEGSGMEEKEVGAPNRIEDKKVTDE